FELGPVEARADLRHVNEPGAVVEAEVQRAEPGPAALRIGVAADYEFQASRALDLQPRVRAPWHVEARDALGHDALQAPFLRRLEGGGPGRPPGVASTARR